MRFQIMPSQDCIIKGASLAPGLYGMFGVKERQSVRQHADHERERLPLLWPKMKKVCFPEWKREVEKRILVMTLNGEPAYT